MTRRAVYLYDNANKDNFVSRTDNFVNVNVFNSVTSPCVLSYCCVLHYMYFLKMPVGFNYNLTFGLKPHVGGMKIVTVYKRSIFHVEWLIATLIVFIVNKLGPFEKPFHKLWLCVSSGFPNTRKKSKHIWSLASCLLQFS